jgi:phosphotransferase system HPr (HPr) family protein
MIAEKSIRSVRIPHEQGLHLRAAATFSQVARRFAWEIRVTCGVRQADGRSLWELLGLVAEPGCELVLEAKGSECEEALDRLSALVAPRFQSCVVEDGREGT